MLRKVVTWAFGIVLYALGLWVGTAWGQSGGGTTHVMLSNDQHFTVSNGKYLSGVYECSDGGYIDSSCVVGHFPEVSCPAGYAIQVISPSITPATCIAVGTTPPAGADTYVQYNLSGVFGADSHFTWDYTNSILTLGGSGPGEATFAGDVLANLGTPSNGTIAYCSNCNTGTNPCTTGGSGAIAERLNGNWVCGGSGTSGTVTSVGLTLPSSIFSIAGSPVTTSGTLAVTLTGVTSGGIPYFSSTSAIGSSGALTANKFVLGGGAGASPTSSAAGDDGTTITTGARNLSYSQALYITGQRALSSSNSAGATDRLVACTSGSSADVTYTLPAATGTGRIIDVFKVDSGTKSCLITVPSGALNTGTTATLTTQFYGETCWDQASSLWVCRGNATIS